MYERPQGYSSTFRRHLKAEAAQQSYAPQYQTSSGPDANDASAQLDQPNLGSTDIQQKSPPKPLKT